MLSLVIPVYKNEENLERLLAALADLNRKCATQLEVVFVVDGSPDRCLEILRERLPQAPMRSLLISLSRNFGSFPAIVAGLKMATGDYFTVLAADLQEPPELVLQFHELLRNDEADIVFGCRLKRSDPWLSEVMSNLFWNVYRRFVIKDMPKGGIDVFGCTRQVRDRLVALREASINPIALLFWLGFRHSFVGYERQARKEGKSAWTFAKKLRYCLDSIFNFTDMPIRLLLYTGVVGMVFSLLCSTLVIISKMMGHIPIPGYTPIVLAVMFFGGFTSLGFGITGQYLWLALQNSRNRPGFIVESSAEYGREPKPQVVGEYSGKLPAEIVHTKN